MSTLSQMPFWWLLPSGTLAAPLVTNLHWLALANRIFICVLNKILVHIKLLCVACDPYSGCKSAMLIIDRCKLTGDVGVFT